ncbi:Fe(3+) ABC transporter substrate-binding protein [Methylophaga sp. 42_25_T18]|nr:Fe(3+) ABC transporter substrate-binding protein [Methylophaga sp. 42_25_T18]OUR88794.1 Fe(3+) ABC transporter substrate-binding protein [Methylophaga sp. 42_8_T64]
MLNLKQKALLALLSAVFAVPAYAAEEVNLYSARKEALIKPLLDRFTEQTGVTVNLITAKADALLKRLESEGKNTPADLLITTDAGRLHRAKSAGLTQAIESYALTQAIPASYRDGENHWFGLSLRARPIVYVKDKVKAEELSTYEALTDAQWKGRICIRSSSNIYNQSLVSSLVATNGVEATETWAAGLVNNFARPPKGGDRDQVKAAASGQCDIAIVNTYYLAGMLSSKDEAQKAAADKVAVFWPNQADRGAHVNVSGAAIMAASKNKENAVKLLEFLSSDESQQWYAETNGEYPIRDGIAISEQLKSWGEFKKDTLNLDQLGALNPEAVRLMDRAGWK